MKYAAVIVRTGMIRPSTSSGLEVRSTHPMTARILATISRRCCFSTSCLTIRQESPTFSTAQTMLMLETRPSWKTAMFLLRIECHNSWAMDLGLQDRTTLSLMHKFASPCREPERPAALLQVESHGRSPGYDRRFILANDMNCRSCKKSFNVCPNTSPGMFFIFGCVFAATFIALIATSLIWHHLLAIAATIVAALGTAVFFFESDAKRSVGRPDSTIEQSAQIVASRTLYGGGAETSGSTGDVAMLDKPKCRAHNQAYVQINDA